ncbi:MAG: hypothetical protein HYW26_02270 [Candidatus Aenigmarchaeota archaeon]|nr:hypothetical protein [Candidatus Aenigmarchaeota archaeon]
MSRLYIAAGLIILALLNVHEYKFSLSRMREIPENVPPTKVIAEENRVTGKYYAELPLHLKAVGLPYRIITIPGKWYAERNFMMERVSQED